MPDPRLPSPAAGARHAKIVLAGTLGGCLLLMSAQARQKGRGPSLLERTGFFVLSPLVAGSHQAAQAEKSVAGSIRSYFGARRENEVLRRRVSSLEEQVFALRAGAEDAAHLRALLKLAPFLPAVRAAAPILSIEERGSYRRALIGAGADSGVLPRSPLAVTAGLVGRVTSVSPRFAKAILVTDADSAVGGRIARTGEQGVVRGDGGELRIDYVSALADVRPGDLVETAGIDGIFPRGIPIGTVTRVTRGKALFLAIRLAPAAPLHRLDDVLVLDPAPSAEDGRSPSE
ncbi:MAG TPA: rod shape-determining protein MreC [Thermoanaerobaculia bacterium]|nr:rod shape-determining protein MreC [Thermoanaerobaculia bacterium]